jgi:hypothetical protein
MWTRSIGSGLEQYVPIVRCQKEEVKEDIARGKLSASGGAVS